jgi:hypothetical protein
MSEFVLELFNICVRFENLKRTSLGSTQKKAESENCSEVYKIR